MKYFKRLLTLIVMLLVSVLVVNAKAVEEVDYDVKSVYINATVDFLGSIHVQEAVVIEGALNGFERTINFRNPRLGNWNGEEINFEKSAIYNASYISLNNVKSFKIKKDEIDWDILSNDSENYELTESASSGDSGVYTGKETDDGIVVRVYNPNNYGYVVYLFDYYVDQAVVIHNDVAELYWTFIPQDFDSIKDAHIQVVLPGESTNDIFRCWAHGPLTGNISPISETKNDDGEYLYRGVLAEVTDVKEGMGVDIRVTFDKGFVAMGSSILNNSGVDALNSIIEVETKRADEANNRRKISRIIYYGIITISSAYLIGLVILWIYVYKKYDKELKVNFDMKYYREFTGDYDVEVVDYLMKKNVTNNAMSASIMNLIYKKNIEVVETEDKKDFILKLKSRDNISKAENELLDLLFDVVTKGEEVTMKQIEKFSSKYTTAEKFMNGYNKWKNTVEETGINEHFFEDNALKRLLFASYIIIGVIIVLIMILCNLIFFPTLVLIFLLSGAFFVYLFTFEKRTMKGREHYLKWCAFKNFLKDFGSFKDKEIPEIILWEKYLVYATVFGLAKEVQEAMKIKLKEMNYDENIYMHNMFFYHNYYIGDSISKSISKSYSNSLSSIAASSNSSGSGFGGGFSSGGGFGGGGGGGHGF